MTIGSEIGTITLGIAAFLLAGAWRELHAFKREIQQWQSKIDTVLFGPEGNNGLNGTMKDHEQRLRVLESEHHA